MGTFVRKCSVVWLILIPLVGSESYFVEKPPPGFANSKRIDECPKIYYPKTQKLYLKPRTGLEPPNLEAAYGIRVFLKEFQHMAAIGWTIDGKVEYKCGGTLITSKFVLTAAHCSAPGEPDTVRLGDTHLESIEDDEYAQQIKIRTFKRHPDHRMQKNYFDIALIELETDAIVTEVVFPACLWLEEKFPLEEMQSVGFGATESQKHSPTLQKVALSKIGEKDCDKQFTGRRFSNGIISHQFCAGNSFMDTCHGDSGGPIQVERTDVNNKQIPLIVGIVSHGTFCTNGSFGVYTRVADFQKWIESETKTSMDYLTCTSSTTDKRKQVYFIIRDTSLSKPFHRVKLLRNVTEDNNVQCGATIIDYQYAITSAFCVNNKPNVPMYIKIESTGETVEIDKIIIHPNYTSKHPENDLALLKLSKYLKRNRDLLPVCLKRERNRKKSDISEVDFSAYATKQLSGHVSNYQITVKAYKKDCKVSKHRQKNLLCASNSIPLVPTQCTMDYGGPVTESAYVSYRYTDILQAHYLKGVVSKLSKECDDELIGIRLSPTHIEWIESVVLDQQKTTMIG